MTPPVLPNLNPAWPLTVLLLWSLAALAVVAFTAAAWWWAHRQLDDGLAAVRQRDAALAALTRTYDRRQT